MLMHGIGAAGLISHLLLINALDSEIEDDCVLAEWFLEVIAFHSIISVAVWISSCICLLSQNLLLRLMSLIKLRYRLMTGLNTLAKYELLSRKFVRWVISFLLV